MRQLLRFTALFALVAGLFGAGLSAQAAPIGILDPGSITYSSTPRGSLAALAYQRLGLYAPPAVSPFLAPPAVTYTATPLQVDSNPGGANPYVDPEWNRKLNMQPGQPAAGIPEPGAALLFAAGFGLVALRTRRSARG